MVTTVPGDQQKPSAKKFVSDCTYAPPNKITHMLISPLTSLEQFLRAIRNAVSQPLALNLPQIKLNSHSAFFFKSAHLIYL